MDDIELKHLPFIVKALMQQAAKTKVELYALRLLVMDCCKLGPEDFERCQAVAANRYATLLRLVSVDPQQEIDLLEFLKAFEGSVQ
jgi:hypothetical protein